MSFPLNCMRPWTDSVQELILSRTHLWNLKHSRCVCLYRSGHCAENCVDSLTVRSIKRLCVATRGPAPCFNGDVPPKRHFAGELQSKRQGLTGGDAFSIGEQVNWPIRSSQ